MITSENVPRCFCGWVFSYWQGDVRHSDVLAGRFNLECPDCKRILRIATRTKTYFEIESDRDTLESRLEVDKEMTVWTYLGKRHDGSIYCASLFNTKEDVISFCDTNGFVAEAVGEMKGTFKLLEKK